VLNANFNNISVVSIVAVIFIGGGNRNTRRKLQTCRKSMANFITKCCIEYTSPWARAKVVGHHLSSSLY